MSLAAKKSFGQNFLRSQKTITTLVSLPNLDRDAVVIEIGPGKGALTRPLLKPAFIEESGFLKFKITQEYIYRFCIGQL